MKLHHVFNAVLAFFLLSAAALAGATPVSAQGTGGGLSDPAEVEAFFDGWMAAQMSRGHVPGAVVALVKDGQVLLSKGYGYADLGERIPVDPEQTLFRAGSVSKLFVWTSVMQLVEQGQLSLETDVNEYLDFTIPATYPEPITLKTLLTHTPGFKDRGEDLFVIKPEKLISLEAYLKKVVPARVFPPGKISAYSNYGAALAGYIVERVSGMPFYEYVEKNIFSPLEMTQATFRQPLPTDLAVDLSSAYNFVQGAYVKAGFEYVVAYPAGSLSVSGSDMAKFMLAHLQNGRYGETRILQEETACRMHSQLYTADTRITGMAYGFFENVFNGQDVISHGGDTLLFHSGLFLFPEQNVGFFISTNAVGGGGMAAAAIRAFVDRYFPVEKAADPVPAADFDSRASKYAGEYYFARNNFTGFEKVLRLMTPIFISVDEDKHVLVSIMGQVSQYVEVEPGLLVNREQPDEMLLMKEQDGQITLYPASPTLPFPLVKSPRDGSMVLHLLVLIGGAILFAITLFRWLVSFFSSLLKREPRPVLARLARLTGGAFALTYLLLLIGFVAVVVDLNPAYGVPNLFFESPAGFDTFVRLPVLLGILAILMMPFALLAWIKRFWTFATRCSYTFLMLLAFAIVWSMVYWNLLL